MDINKLTIGEAREIATLFGKVGPCTTMVPYPYELGENYFIRTVTHHFTGKLADVYQGELVLTNAAWIADDGRFMDAVKDGTFKEVEPFPADSSVIINRASIIDMVKVGFKLPTSQK
jgi:hypothetical protein